jgi:hypothetical protein
MTPTGRFTDVHDMNGTTDGYGPVTGVIQATDGEFYGVNYGSNWGTIGGCCGSIFKVTAQGGFSSLYDFDATTGDGPGDLTLLQHTNGMLYGARECGGTGSSDDPNCTSGGGVFYSWNAGLKSFVSLLPYSGKVGNTIEFLGQGFTGATHVSFNRTSATFTVKSDTYLTAIVPTGATTGFVRVTTPSGALRSNRKFLVTP